MRTKRITGVLAALAMAVATGVAVSVTPASAAGGCAGRIIDHQDLTAINGPYVGQFVGRVNLYWDGTYNCVVFTKAGGPYYGVPTPMGVLIENEAGEFRQDPTERTFYSYYAGPAKVNGVGQSIRWTAKLLDSSDTVIAHYEQDFYH
ncbi:hypothetical protein [Kitasatospora sp. NPDC051914]|uniref:hypothetical protein n=1 Tax=Kitasatospora sp. NPDC051914 TaxID=3154945 RepID=UPI00343154E5